MSKLYLSVIFLFLIGCHFQNQDVTMQVHKSESLSEDIQIPKHIFDTIEKNIHLESASAQPVYLFQPLEVIIASVEKSVIPEPQKFILANGGGQIDLKAVLKGQGSFYFYFPEEQFAKLPELESLYFISDFPKTVIDKENFGIGCSKWIDLKEQFTQFSKPQKTIINTTAQRYLYVAGGYYILVFRKGNQVYLSHLYLTDTNYTSLKCPTKNELTKEN